MPLPSLISLPLDLPFFLASPFDHLFASSLSLSTFSIYVCVFICIAMYLPIYMYLHISVFTYTSAYLSAYLPIFLAVSLSPSKQFSGPYHFTTTIFVIFFHLVKSDWNTTSKIISFIQWFICLSETRLPPCASEGGFYFQRRFVCWSDCTYVPLILAALCNSELF